MAQSGRLEDTAFSLSNQDGILSGPDDEWRLEDDKDLCTSSTEMENSDGISVTGIGVHSNRGSDELTATNFSLNKLAKGMPEYEESLYSSVEMVFGADKPANFFY